jgi:DNA-binding NarL/FixJ family response regulator
MRAVRTARALRVFICDDVEEVRLLVRSALEGDPDMAIVGEASDGVAALEGIRASRPDVVVLDLAMPQTDGLEVLRALRTTEPGIRVVVFSGLGDAETTEAVRRLGASRFVPKGAPLADLCDAVRDLPLAPVAA